MYTRTTYEGVPLFQCTDCPRTRFDEGLMRDHILRDHPGSSVEEQELAEALYFLSGSGLDLGQPELVAEGHGEPAPEIESTNEPVVFDQEQTDPGPEPDDDEEE